MELANEALASWSANGWILLEGALDERMVEALSDGVDVLETWAADGGPGLHHFEQTEHGATLARSERFADDHAELSAFVRSGLVTDVVGALFGEPAALFKEKVNYKQPGGAGFAPHQDAAAYRFVDHHISVMVPLDPSTIASGCLWFAPGHTAGAMATDEGGRLTDEVVRDLAWQPVEVKRGDLVAFDSYAPHRSGTNRADHPRRALYLTYNAASSGDFRERYYADKDAEFAAGGDTFESGRPRISISDDFLGVPVS